jgi:alpha,alpha-trehalose phosphorylase
LVSFTERHVAALSYEVTLLNASAPVVLSSELVEHHQPRMLGEEDPRLAHRLDRAVLVSEVRVNEQHRLLRGYTTRSSRMTLACGIDHVSGHDGAMPGGS